MGETVDSVDIYRGLRVRMGVHAGNPTAETDPVTGRMDYFGPMVNRSARVEGTAHGGQIVISGDCYTQIQDALESDEFGEVEVKDMGQHRLKGLQTDTQLFQILPKSLAGRIFPEYGVKPELEVEQSLQSEMELLVKENTALKTKLSTTEQEAKAAMERAEELGKWLEEISADIPDSLGKAVLTATKNIGKVMKTQSCIGLAIEEARKNKTITKKKLENSERLLADANERVKELEMMVEKNNEQLADYEYELYQKKKSGIINRFKNIRVSRDDTKKTEPEEEFESRSREKSKKERKSSIRKKFFMSSRRPKSTYVGDDSERKKESNLYKRKSVEVKSTQKMDNIPDGEDDFEEADDLLESNNTTEEPTQDDVDLAEPKETEPTERRKRSKGRSKSELKARRSGDKKKRLKSTELIADDNLDISNVDELASKERNLTS